MHNFEDDPRTREQLTVDMDSLDVTISMYAVTDRQGQRKTQSVFRAEPEDWNAVGGTYHQFKAESGFSSIGLPSYQEAGKIWVVTDSRASFGVLRIAGAAEVHPTSSGGYLAWVWVHPLRRGSKKGFTPLLANRLADEYGTLIPLPQDTLVNAITPAGHRFLNHYFPL